MRWVTARPISKPLRHSVADVGPRGCQAARGGRAGHDRGLAGEPAHLQRPAAFTRSWRSTDASYVTVAPAYRRRTVKGCVRTYVMHQQLLEDLPDPRASLLEVGERLVVIGATGARASPTEKRSKAQQAKEYSRR